MFVGFLSFLSLLRPLFFSVDRKEFKQTVWEIEFSLWGFGNFQSVHRLKSKLNTIIMDKVKEKEEENEAKLDFEKSRF